MYLVPTTGRRGRPGSAAEQLTQERRRDIIDPDAYWTERFRVSESRLPVFLKAWARLVCDTGKYINVLQEIGIVPTAHAGPKVRWRPRRRGRALAHGPAPCRRPLR